MGEKIIQPPFYNSGFYNTGAGGGFNDALFFSNFVKRTGTIEDIVLDNELSNKDLNIRLNFVKYNSTTQNPLFLYTSNEEQVARIKSTNDIQVSNSDAAGDVISWSNTENPVCVIIRNNAYRVWKKDSFNDWPCPYVENNFKIIRLSTNIVYQRITLYRTDYLGTIPEQILHDFLPYYKDGVRGLIDIITGNIYEIQDLILY